MEPDCKKIVKVVLPAIRASVAEVMSSKYNYNQQEIATKLGIAQVSVSKYLNGRYSKDIMAMKSYIIEHRLNRNVISDIVSGKGKKTIELGINKLCGSVINAT